MNRFPTFRNVMGDGTRTQTDVMNDILVCCLKGEGKTRTMFDCNLNSMQIKDYFQHLIKFDLLEETFSNFSVRPIYRTTKKGNRFIILYTEILGMFVAETAKGAEKTTEGARSP